LLSTEKIATGGRGSALGPEEKTCEDSNRKAEMLNGIGIHYAPLMTADESLEINFVAQKEKEFRYEAYSWI
jgi:hypothetical protein